MNRLIITCATVPSINLQRGEYEVRTSDYLSSFYHANRFKNEFDSITIIECISKSEKYLEEVGIPVYYSNYNNDLNAYDKSMNEISHIWDFVKQDYIDDDDVIIKLSGRYILYDTSILSYFNNKEIDAVAKDADDIYRIVSSKGVEYGNEGVHTFLWGFRKKFFRQLYDYAVSVRAKGDNHQIEKMTKEFIIRYKLENITFRKPQKIIILSKDDKIGCITCLWSHVLDIGEGVPNFLKLYV